MSTRHILNNLYSYLAGFTDKGDFVTQHGLGAVVGQEVSPRCWHTGSRSPSSSTDGTDTTPVVTEAYVAEIFIPVRSDVVTGIAILNGSAVAGNVIAALYDSDGVKMATAVAGVAGTGIAQSGTAGYQRLPFTGGARVLRGPRTGYILLMCGNTSARFRSHVFGNFGAGKLTGLTSLTPPASFTVPTTFTTNLGPMASLY